MDYFVYRDNLHNAVVAISIIYGRDFKPSFMDVKDNLIQLRLVGNELSNEEKDLLKFYGNLM